MMIQTLRRDYGVHRWFEHMPFELSSADLKKPARLLAHPGLATVYSNTRALSRKNRKFLWRKAQNDVDMKVMGTKWKLRRAVDVKGMKMADKKLSYESDRPKVLFLEWQAGLLGRE